MEVSLGVILCQCRVGSDRNRLIPNPLSLSVGQKQHTLGLKEVNGSLEIMTIRMLLYNQPSLVEGEADAECS